MMVKLAKPPGQVTTDRTEVSPRIPDFPKITASLEELFCPPKSATSMNLSTWDCGMSMGTEKMWQLLCCISASCCILLRNLPMNFHGKPITLT